jgi:hypothetical protein
MKLNDLINEVADLFDEIMIENEALKILEESQIYDTLTYALKKLDKDLAEMKEQLFKSDQATVKEIFRSVVSLAKKTGSANNTNWNDDKTQKAIYLVYNKKILPMLKQYYALCKKWNSENEEKLPLEELGAIINTTMQGDTSKSNLEYSKQKKVFDY